MLQIRPIVVLLAVASIANAATPARLTVLTRWVDKSTWFELGATQALPEVRVITEKTKIYFDLEGVRLDFTNTNSYNVQSEEGVPYTLRIHDHGTKTRVVVDYVGTIPPNVALSQDRTTIHVEIAPQGKEAQVPRPAGNIAAKPSAPRR